MPKYNFNHTEETEREAHWRLPSFQSVFMAGAAHRTTAAITAAGGFSFFLIFHQLNYDQGDNGKQYSRYGDCRNIGV